MFEFEYHKFVGILGKELQSWLEAAIKALPNVALAIVVLIITGIVASFVDRLVSKFLSKTTRNRAALQLVEKILLLTLWAVGFFIALGVLNLEKTVTSLLAGAGVLGLALGFAFQEIAANFVSGVLIAFQEPYRIGDIVQVGSFLGEVKVIELRSTTITTFDGLDVLVPNKKMYTESLTNYTSTPMRRMELTGGVSYSDDLRKVEKVAIAAIEPLPGRIQSKDIQFFFREFGDSAITFVLYVWVEYPANGNFNRYRHESIIALKRAFDENEISIPFPMRTLDLNLEQVKQVSDSFRRSP